MEYYRWNSILRCYIILNERNFVKGMSWTEDGELHKLKLGDYRILRQQGYTKFLRSAIGFDMMPSSPPTEKLPRASSDKTLLPIVHDDIIPRITHHRASRKLNPEDGIDYPSASGIQDRHTSQLPSVRRYQTQGISERVSFWIKYIGLGMSVMAIFIFFILPAIVLHYTDIPKANTQADCYIVSMTNKSTVTLTSQDGEITLNVVTKGKALPHALTISNPDNGIVSLSCGPTNKKSGINTIIITIWATEHLLVAVTTTWRGEFSTSNQNSSVNLTYQFYRQTIYRYGLFSWSS